VRAVVIAARPADQFEQRVVVTPTRRGFFTAVAIHWSGLGIEDINGNENRGICPILPKGSEVCFFLTGEAILCVSPAFRHLWIEPLPYSTANAMAGAHEGGGAMEITIHQHLIEQCVMMACASKANRDKALWLSMAQSWMRLADEVAQAEMAYVANGTQQRH
jgi:hypothetical protein